MASLNESTLISKDLLIENLIHESHLTIGVGVSVIVNGNVYIKGDLKLLNDACLRVKGNATIEGQLVTQRNCHIDTNTLVASKISIGSFNKLQAVTLTSQGTLDVGYYSKLMVTHDTIINELLVAAISCVYFHGSLECKGSVKTSVTCYIEAKEIKASSLYIGAETKLKVTRDLRASMLAIEENCDILVNGTIYIDGDAKIQSKCKVCITHDLVLQTLEARNKTQITIGGLLYASQELYLASDSCLDIHRCIYIDSQATLGHGCSINVKEGIGMFGSLQLNNSFIDINDSLYIQTNFTINRDSSVNVAGDIVSLGGININGTLGINATGNVISPVLVIVSSTLMTVDGSLFIRRVTGLPMRTMSLLKTLFNGDTKKWQTETNRVGLVVGIINSVRVKGDVYVHGDVQVGCQSVLDIGGSLETSGRLMLGKEAYPLRGLRPTRKSSISIGGDFSFNKGTLYNIDKGIIRVTGDLKFDESNTELKLLVEELKKNNVLV